MTILLESSSSYILVGYILKIEIQEFRNTRFDIEPISSGWKKINHEDIEFINELIQKLEFNNQPNITVKINVYTYDIFVGGATEDSSYDSIFSFKKGQNLSKPKLLGLLGFEPMYFISSNIHNLQYMSPSLEYLFEYCEENWFEDWKDALINPT